MASLLTAEGIAGFPAETPALPARFGLTLGPDGMSGCALGSASEFDGEPGSGAATASGGRVHGVGPGRVAGGASAPDSALASLRRRFATQGALSSPMLVGSAISSPMLAGGGSADDPGDEAVGGGGAEGDVTGDPRREEAAMAGAAQRRVGAVSGLDGAAVGTGDEAGEDDDRAEQRDVGIPPPPAGSGGHDRRDRDPARSRGEIDAGVAATWPRPRSPSPEGVGADGALCGAPSLAVHLSQGFEVREAWVGTRDWAHPEETLEASGDCEEEDGGRRNGEGEGRGRRNGEEENGARRDSEEGGDTRCGAEEGVDIRRDIEEKGGGSAGGSGRPDPFSAPSRAVSRDGIIAGAAERASQSVDGPTSRSFQEGGNVDPPRHLPDLDSGGGGGAGSGTATGGSIGGPSSRGRPDHGPMRLSPSSTGGNNAPSSPGGRSSAPPTFYPPSAVFADPDPSGGLSPRRTSSGLSVTFPPLPPAPTSSGSNRTASASAGSARGDPPLGAAGTASAAVGAGSSSGGMTAGAASTPPRRRRRPAARSSPLGASPLAFLRSPHDPLRGTPDRDIDGFTLHSQPAYERTLRNPRCVESPSSSGIGSPALAAWWSGHHHHHHQAGGGGGAGLGGGLGGGHAGPGVAVDTDASATAGATCAGPSGAPGALPAHRSLSRAAAPSGAGHGALLGTTVVGAGGYTLGAEISGFRGGARALVCEDGGIAPHRAADSARPSRGCPTASFPGECGTAAGAAAARAAADRARATAARADAAAAGDRASSGGDGDGAAVGGEGSHAGADAKEAPRGADCLPGGAASRPHVAVGPPYPPPGHAYAGGQHHQHQHHHPGLQSAGPIAGVGIGGMYLGPTHGLVPASRAFAFAAAGGRPVGALSSAAFAQGGAGGAGAVGAGYVACLSSCAPFGAAGPALAPQHGCQYHPPPGVQSAHGFPSGLAGAEPEPRPAASSCLGEPDRASSAADSARAPGGRGADGARGDGGRAGGGGSASCAALEAGPSGAAAWGGGPCPSRHGWIPCANQHAAHPGAALWEGDLSTHDPSNSHLAPSSTLASFPAAHAPHLSSMLHHPNPHHPSQHYPNLHHPSQHPQPLPAASLLGAGSTMTSHASPAIVRRRPARSGANPLLATPPGDISAAEGRTPVLELCAPIGVSSDSTRKLFPIFKPKRHQKSLLLVRHGESEFNAGTARGGDEGGAWDDPLVFDARLTERGRAEARALGARLAAMGIPDDALWVSSPLCRALETMLIAVAAMREARARGVGVGSGEGDDRGALGAEDEGAPDAEDPTAGPGGDRGRDRGLAALPGAASSRAGGLSASRSRALFDGVETGENDGPPARRAAGTGAAGGGEKTVAGAGPVLASRAPLAEANLAAGPGWHLPPPRDDGALSPQRAAADGAPAPTAPETARAACGRGCGRVTVSPAPPHVLALAVGAAADERGAASGGGADGRGAGTDRSADGLERAAATDAPLTAARAASAAVLSAPRSGRPADASHAARGEASARLPPGRDERPGLALAPAPHPLPEYADPLWLPASVEVRPEISEKLVTTGDVGRPPRALAEEFPCLAEQLAPLPETWWFSRPEKPNSAAEMVLRSLEPQRNVLRRIAGFKTWLGGRPEKVVIAFGHASFWGHFCAGYCGVKREKMKNCEIRRLQV